MGIDLEVYKKSNKTVRCGEGWDYKPVAEKNILSLLDKALKNKVCCEIIKEDILC